MGFTQDVMYNLHTEAIQMMVSFFTVSDPA